MVSKRGQVSLYIIVGIVILLLVILGIYFFVYQKDILLEDRLVAPSMRPIKNLVDECIETSATTGIFLLGTQGGYVLPPPGSLVTPHSIIAYALDEGKNTLVTRAEIEEQIAAYVDSTLRDCLDNFAAFPGKEIRQGKDIVSTAKITKDNVVVSTSYVVELIEEDAQNRLESFVVDVPIRLGHIIDTASVIVAKQQEDPDWIDITYLSEQDLQIDLSVHDEETMLVTMTDETATEEGPYMFIFAERFKRNSAPVISALDRYDFTDGTPVRFQIIVEDPDGDELVLEDDSIFFDIKQDGFIEFTPEVRGEFDFTVTATDSHGKESSKKIAFTVSD